MFILFSICGLTYAVVAWTPLREKIVPGYVSEDSRQQAIVMENRADSALLVLEQNQRYLGVLKALLQGEILDVPGEVDRLIEAAEDTAVIPAAGLAIA